MSFTIIKQDSLGNQNHNFNYALYFFSPVLTNTETIIEVNFSFLKNLYSVCSRHSLSICIYL